MEITSAQINRIHACPTLFEETGESVRWLMKFKPWKEAPQSRVRIDKCPLVCYCLSYIKLKMRIPIKSTRASQEASRGRDMNMKHFFVMVTVAFLTLVLLSPGEGKNRPTGQKNSDLCLTDLEADSGCGGLICYCCYNDGCWICNNNFGDCVWDPAYRTQLGTLPQTGLTISPQSGYLLTQEALINLLEKKEVVTKKELVEEMTMIRKARKEGALEGGRLKESVAEQKRINRYFHTVVVPKLKTCWDQLEGKGAIEMKFRYEDNAKGEWAFKMLEGGKSNLPEGQAEAALACMRKAVTATSFPREKSDTGASYSINWDWPVPMPPDAAQQVERMLGSGGGEGGGCDGHGASARCVTCSGGSCIYVCVGYDSCTIPARSPDPTVIRMCQEQGKCASGGPFGVVGGVIMY